MNGSCARGRRSKLEKAVLAKVKNEDSELTVPVVLYVRMNLMAILSAGWSSCQQCR